MGVDVELVEQPRTGRPPARDVVEADVADRRDGAVMQPVAHAAVRVEHDQDVLRAPDAQLARRLARLGVERLAQELRVGRVGDVDHHHAAVRLTVAAVGPAPDVRVVLVDRDGGVHAAAQQRLVPDLPQGPPFRAAGGGARHPGGIVAGRSGAPGRTGAPGPPFGEPFGGRRPVQHRVVAVRGMRGGRARQQRDGRERGRGGAHVVYASLGHDLSPVVAAPSRSADCFHGVPRCRPHLT